MQISDLPFNGFVFTQLPLSRMSIEDVSAQASPSSRFRCAENKLEILYLLIMFHVFRIIGYAF